MLGGSVQIPAKIVGLFSGPDGSPWMRVQLPDGQAVRLPQRVVLPPHEPTGKRKEKK